MRTRLTISSLRLSSLTISAPLCLWALVTGCQRSEEVTPGPPESEQASAGPSAASGNVSAIPAEHLDRVVEQFNKGVGLMDQFKPSEAAETFKKVVTLAPNWTTGRLNYGIALLNAPTSQARRRAERELKWVIRADPDNCHAHYALGMLLVYMDRNQEARGHFKKVLEVDPNDGDTHYQMGVLLSDSAPQKARQHFEATLERIPHHASALYQLQSLLRKAGKTERALELLERFQTLTQAGAGVRAGIKYGEMGRYASVVRVFPRDSVTEPPSDAAPILTDEAEQAGLKDVTGGGPGWPGSMSNRWNFGPGAAAADVDGDEDLDLLIPGMEGETASPLLLNDQGIFTGASTPTIDDRDAVGAYFADYDRDGDADLFLTCRGINRLYQNDGQSQFRDVTEMSGVGGGNVLSIGAAWADADHDGDLDLYVANFAPAETKGGPRGAPNSLYRNNGNGTFTDVTEAAGVDGGEAASVGVVFFDTDGDRDLDLYVVNHESTNRLFLNERVGQYREATAQYELLADDGPGLGGVLGDVDGNGYEDLLLIRGTAPPRLFLQMDRGQFTEDTAFGATGERLGGATGGLLVDLDLDTDLDLVLFDAGREKKTGHRILNNRGNGQFTSPIELGPQNQPPDAHGAIAVNIDGAGGMELLVARAGARPELWRASNQGESHWLEVVPQTTAASAPTSLSPTSVGLQVELKSGFRLQVANVASSSGYLGAPPARAYFGLGRHGKADYVRLSWPDAVLQSELEVPADRVWRVSKVQRKPSSCPILFSWDGERFSFVTDFLGVGGIGFFVSPGKYAPPDPSENVRIPPRKLVARDGKYLLRIAEPLEEVAYLDQLHLLAYDHPAGWEIYPDERFTATEPLPTGRPLAVAEKLFPQRARNHNGQDVHSLIREIDRQYVEPPPDKRFVGYATDHWIELDFANRLQEVADDARLMLYLYGWVEYTYSHVNYAAHQAGLTMQSPSIEVPDGEGQWQTVISDAGFPAGLPRMMAVDISSLPIRDSGRIRIRTNMEVFWDQIFVAEDFAEDVADGQLQTHRMLPVGAALRPLGYPQEYSPDGRHPTRYDYHRLDQGLAFKNLSGDYTRFGDVRPLLKDVDDRFVIMGRGEEIALEFDASDLPELPEGWSRTVMLHADGYCKDMDLYTAKPDSVAPLPFHSMENYPPQQPGPQDQEHLLYRRRWNTRTIAGE